jgi:hypothetical protein
MFSFYFTSPSLRQLSFFTFLPSQSFLILLLKYPSIIFYFFLLLLLLLLLLFCLRHRRVPRSTKLLVARVRQLHDKMPKVVLTRHTRSSYFYFRDLLFISLFTDSYSCSVILSSFAHLLALSHCLRFLLLSVFVVSSSIVFFVLLFGSILLSFFMLTVFSLSPSSSQVVMPILESIEGVSRSFLEIIEKK